MFKMGLDKSSNPHLDTMCTKNKDFTKYWLENLENNMSKMELDKDKLLDPQIRSIENGESQKDYEDGETDFEDDKSSMVASSYSESIDSDLTDTDVLDPQLRKSLDKVFSIFSNEQTLSNVNICHSQNIHIGNVTNINGTIKILVSRENKAKKNYLEEDGCLHSQKSRASSNYRSAEDEKSEWVPKKIFIDDIKIKMPQKTLNIVPRYAWLAQKPMEPYTYLKEPVEFVIISHTATESSERQAENVRTIRHIQCFHIESYGWDDIAYNFLIGCDGNVYEGRGWGIVGAHTKGYNNLALGVSFIGCFMNELPSKSAFNACKELLKKAVENGHLDANYKLLAHCQCSATESPGRQLYKEIQNWEHFYQPEL